MLLSAAGKMFTSGIDLGDLTQLASLVYGDDDTARKSLKLYNKVSWYQDQFTDLERCKKPIIGKFQDFIGNSFFYLKRKMHVRLHCIIQMIILFHFLKNTEEILCVAGYFH